jgi:hypothetical protein
MDFAFPLARSRRRQALSWRAPRRSSHEWLIFSTPKSSTRVEKGAKRATDTLGLAHIKEVIADSKKILALENDWDGEGGQAYSEKVLERATSFLWNYALRVRSLFGVAIEPPKVLPGPHGSIDIHWKSDTRELLVNVPADPKQLANFYGDDYGEVKIKGTFDPETYNLGILGWFLESPE